MTTVKPSKQYEMTVVPHRPYWRFLQIFALSLTFLLAVIGSFLVGRYYGVVDTGGIDVELAEVKSQYTEKLDEAAKLEQQVANLRLAAEVDRKANEKVRGEVVDLKTQVAELEQDNTFYRSLMRPAPGDKGLVVDAPAITSTNIPNVYQYNVVIKQIVTQHRLVSGYVQFELLGKRGDIFQRLVLKDLSDTISVERIKLKFKYFQRIEGEMSLPDGFVPERIELKVVTERPNKVTIDKKFGWSLKKS
ncbi:MAG: DUF6776 family protein [Cellvibrionaceae bacterium]